jgi:hypothetical protein
MAFDPTVWCVIQYQAGYYRQAIREASRNPLTQGGSSVCARMMERPYANE